MKINVALFGLGRIGIMHAQNIKLNNKFHLKYVYDIDKKLSLNVSKKLKSKSIKNPNVALKDKNIKVIFISSSTSTHISSLANPLKLWYKIFTNQHLYPYYFLFLSYGMTCQDRHNPASDAKS